jgi:superfamily II DNA or RNA helicase
VLGDLRPYQSDAIHNLRAEIKAGRRRIMLSSATGSGKSRIITEMAVSSAAKGKRVIVFCDRIQLVQQMAEHLALAGLSFGVIQGENTSNDHRRVLVASIQTVARRGLPTETDLVLIDEAHGCAGRKEYLRVIAAAMGQPKTVVVGFSATPWTRGLGKVQKSLGGPLFESMVNTVPISYLIEHGFLVDADVYAPVDPDLTGVGVSAGDFNEAQLGEAMNKPKLVGGIVDHWLKLAHELPTVVFAVNIAHSQSICEEFARCGVKAEHISCYTPADERLAILARVASGETKVICNAMLLTTGWDFPACRCMILARPTRSLVTYVQMVGRVLRPYHGKERAIVLDHSGSSLRLGFPTDDRSHIPLCTGAPKKSGGKEQEEKKDVLPKPCPACHFLKRPRQMTCPACGFTARKPAEVEVIDGDLSLVKKSRKHQAAEALGTKQEVWSMLLGHVKNRGYQRGFASNKYREIFGVWPKGLSDTPTHPNERMSSWLVASQIRWAKGKARREATV